eukprot:gene3199-5515_t
MKYVAGSIIFGIFKLSEMKDLWRTDNYMFEYPEKSKALPRESVGVNIIELMNESFQSCAELGTAAIIDNLKIASYYEKFQALQTKKNENGGQLNMFLELYELLLL